LTEEVALLVRVRRSTFNALDDVTGGDWRNCGARGGVSDAWRTDARN
jgi:hypothetical protein